MIPTVSIIKVLATTIGFVVAYLSYKRWKKTGLISFNYFWKLNLFHALECGAFLVFGVLGLVFKNLYAVQIAWNLAGLAGTLILVYFIPLVLVFFGVGEKYQKIAKWFFLALALFNFASAWFSFDKAKVVTYPIPGPGDLTGIFWINNMSRDSVIFTGVSLVVFIMFPSLLLFIKAMRERESALRRKGILLSFGTFAVGLSGLWFYFYIPLFGTSFWNDVFGGMSCALGQILFTLGMLRKEKGLD